MGKETMTGRERIIKTIKGEKTDRMPIDLGMHFSTGISAFAYFNLRKHLGLSTDNVEMIDMTQMLARVDEDIIERFHIDTILLNPAWPGRKHWNIREDYSFIIPPTANPKLLQDGKWEIELNSERAVLLEGGYFMEGGWPDYYCLPQEEKLDLFAARAERIYKETDKYTMLMGFPAYFGGLDFACDMITDPEECAAHNERLLKEQIAYFDKANKKMGKYINCIEVNSDLGTQENLLCRPEDYRELCMPYLKDFCSHVHNTSDIQIFMHSCGAMSELLPDIINSGVDAINPVQISAKNMDPKTLKERFGGKIAFWGGGCDTQSILNFADEEKVKEHVRENVRIFKENGGFVFNQVHNIMGDVKPENIVAMLDTAYEESFYN